ncbi:MAG: DUF1508 domain-containing protein [Acidobacteria bacterium]|nr:DUF1508 domain-containing protein [Acidobacteriota bacterium]MBV9478594.1 DUF1508 domain-containing protein [Acidobacteriota bacterium]
MHYEKYKDNRGEWRWTFYSGNNKIIAVSSEGYDTERACDDSIALIKGSANAPVRTR